MSEEENTGFLKKELRERVGRLRRSLSKEDREAFAMQLRLKLKALPEYQKAGCIYGYMEANCEVPVSGLLSEALLEGKRVALPKVEGKRISFYYVTDIAQDTVKGSFSIREPKNGLKPAEEKTALVLVPGLAFSRDGGRLGYGGGYYDRFLSAEPEHFSIGIGYGFQLFDALPLEAQDIMLNKVLAC